MRRILRTSILSMVPGEKSKDQQGHYSLTFRKTRARAGSGISNFVNVSNFRLYYLTLSYVSDAFKFNRDIALVPSEVL